MSEVRSILTPRLFSEKYPAFPIGSVRNLIYHEDENGLKAAGAIKRIGKKIIIDEGAFFLWLDEQNKSGVR